jgi:hypothetical protein
MLLSYLENSQKEDKFLSTSFINLLLPLSLSSAYTLNISQVPFTLLDDVFTVCIPCQLIVHNCSQNFNIFHNFYVF